VGSRAGRVGEPPLRNQDRILAAAASLFAARGYGGTSMEAISRAVGLTKPALYWHFGNKERLLVAVLEEGIETVIEGVRGPPGLRPGPQRLVEVTDRWRALVHDRADELRLPVMMAVEFGNGSEAVRRAVEHVWRRAEQAIADGIAAAVSDDLADLDLLANTAVVLLQGSLLRHRVDGDDAALDRRLAEFRRVIVTGVLARRKAGTRAAAAPSRLPVVPTRRPPPG